MVGFDGDDRFQPGLVLGPYQLVVPVGAGGMASVWAARVRGTGQLVALKLLLPQLAENVAFQQMFVDEARIASRVRHPNVATTFELASYDGVLMLVMEYVDGTSLVRMFRPGYEHDGDDVPRHPLPYRHAAHIIAEAAAGLHAAHELVGDDGRPLAVVHRDVSPHNILFTADGRVKVTDFGVAKALGKQHMTIAGQVKGKLAYMSPEQLVGGGAIDRRSDIFGLGCSLYEITTGKRPFVGDHDPQVMAAIMMGMYEPPSALAPDLPKALEQIIVRALANEPEQRYPTAEHLRAALDGFVRASGPPIGARDIAALVHERCGGDIATRARALDDGQPKAAPAAPAPPRYAPAQSTGNGVEIDRQSAEGYSTLGLLGAALLGSALGIGILAYVRSTRVKKEPPPIVAVTPLPATSSAAPAATLVAAAPRVVHFKVVPENAVLVVDGVPVPSVAGVPRPNDGRMTTVLVRADGHQDTIVLVDGTTSDLVEVSLVPTPAPKPKPLRPFPVASAKGPDAPPTTPPNPYD